MTTKSGSGKKIVPPEKAEPHKRYPQGSFFYAASNCEAAFALSRASGEEPPTPFSDKGTLVHGILSESVSPEGVEEGILQEADQLKRLEALSLEDWLLPEVPFTEIRERRLWMRSGMQPLYSGQPDKFVVQGRRVYLSDYKTGWHPLDDWVATNSQIRAYVALIDVELKGEVDEVTAAIHKPGKQSPPAIFDRQAIDASIAWAIAVARTALAGGKKKTPTRGPWCKYCSGKVLCPLWKTEITTLSDLGSAIISDIPDSALRDLAPRLELAKTVAEKLLERLYARVKANPEFFSDWRFAPPAPRRKVTDVVDAYNALVVKAGLLSPGEFLSACRLTIGEVEKFVRSHASQELSIQAVKALLDTHLAGIMTYAQGKAQLVYDPKSLPQTALPPK